MNDTQRLIVLNMVEDLGSIRTRSLLRHFGSLDKIFQAKEDDLEEAEGIGPKIASKIVKLIKEIKIDKELGLVRKNDVRVITFLDRIYPKNLRNIYDPPMVLYVKGDILAQDDISIAIVGSRLASFYGIKTSERLGFELASRGLTVISGLARGIDSSAHRGALKAKGRTLAVLGSGILNIYPEEHASLADEISRSGALISEFPMSTHPEKGNFPKRNRVISGLSMGVVVVEAGERSGALITSDIAIEQGRDVFSVPGNIDSVNSRGTHKLIKQGAKLVETADDIIEELDLQLSLLVKENRVASLSKLDKEATLVYNLLSSEPRHIDELCQESGMGVTELSKVLLGLEMKRFIRQLPGKNFVKL